MKKAPNPSIKSSDSRFLDWEATKGIAAFLRDPAVDAPDAEGLPRMSDYEVHEHLGTGSSGSVYMAIPKAQPESIVAVKLFKAGPSSGAPPARILRELDLLAALQLPCVPRILDYGVDEGRFFITTEVVRGTKVHRHCEANSLSREERVQLLVKIALAVQQLHEFGVIHRDLKPSNIMINHDGEPMLIDLGIATLLEDTLYDTITAEGMPIGSPGFMAPEQARGERLATTIRSDVYSLGATTCYLLTGQTPHDADGSLHEVIRRVAEEPPRHPRQLDPSLPKPLAAVLAKSTAGDPSDRFSSAADLASHLNMWLDGEPFALAAPSLYRRLSYRCRRNPWAAASGALATIAVLGAVYFSNVAIADSRLADARAQLAEERAEDRARLAEARAADQAKLAEARKAYAEQRKIFAQDAKIQLEQVQALVVQFLDRVRGNSDAGQFGEALKLIHGIDHLLAGTDFGDANLPVAHREARVSTLVDAIAAIYRTSEFGGDEIMRDLEQLLEELERHRMNTQLRDQ